MSRQSDEASMQPERAVQQAGRGLSFRTLGTFFALTYGLTWGLAALYFAFTEQVEALFGELGYTNPIFVLAVYSPAIAAVALVWRHHGLRGVGRFVRRLTLWRMPLVWWVVLLVGVPAGHYLGAVFTGTIGDPFPFSPWYTVLPALLIALSIGPVEELGWRGVGLPLLQRRFPPLAAGTILGAVWGLWHIPAFIADGTPQQAWSFTPYFIGGIAISIILTAMFNAARGSILVPILFHWQVNNPIPPDSLPWAALAFTVMAAGVVVLNWRTMTSRTTAATDVLLADRLP